MGQKTVVKKDAKVTKILIFVFINTGYKNTVESNQKHRTKAAWKNTKEGRNDGCFEGDSDNILLGSLEEN
jgi:hypothetical protein